MARVELKDVSKRFTSPPRPGVDSGVYVVAPLFGGMLSAGPKDRTRQMFSIENLNLTIPDGKTVVILGPSGCGKTTLLRLIAGLDPLDSGQIFFDGVDVSQAQPAERKVGMVFQNYALYPNITSKANILSYFRFRKKTEALSREAEEKFQRTSELLGVEIDYLLDRDPGHLSSGEKQRVAIGRCITRDPNVFLMDEPLSHLDARLREKYRLQLRRLLTACNVTTVYVTHDQQEALILADILVLMDDGRIVQTGTFEAIYSDPANLFVAEFVNPNTETVSLSVIDGATISDRWRNVLVGARPGDIEIHSRRVDRALPAKIAAVRDIAVRDTTVVDAVVGQREISALLPGHAQFEAGQDVWLSFKRSFLFDESSGERVGGDPWG